MRITATALRSNIYKVLDEIIETGVPVEIERNGAVLRIVPDKPKLNKLDNIKPIPNLVVGDIEDLDKIDWSDVWEWDDDLS